MFYDLPSCNREFLQKLNKEKATKECGLARTQEMRLSISNGLLQMPPPPWYVHASTTKSTSGSTISMMHDGLTWLDLARAARLRAAERRSSLTAQSLEGGSIPPVDTPILHAHKQTNERDKVRQWQCCSDQKKKLKQETFREQNFCLYPTIFFCMSTVQMDNEFIYHFIKLKCASTTGKI